MTVDSGVYDRALAGEQCWVRTSDGRRQPPRTDRWLGYAAAGSADQRVDVALLCCCDGPTVDLGCGPGRLVEGLVRRGVCALGVDISAMAVAVTRLRGGPALQRDMFGPLPGAGRWSYAILADGNLGIGGDPVRILKRTRELLAPGGVAIVEFARPGTGMVACQLRLESPSGTGEWFPWARVGVDCADEVAAAAGLRVITTAEVSGRHIVWLERHHHPTENAVR